MKEPQNVANKDCFDLNSFVPGVELYILLRVGFSDWEKQFCIIRHRPRLQSAESALTKLYRVAFETQKHTHTKYETYYWNPK